MNEQSLYVHLSPEKRVSNGDLLDLRKCELVKQEFNRF